MVEHVMAVIAAIWIQTAEPKLSASKSFEYAEMITQEAIKWGINPKLVIAIAWHESDFRSGLTSPSADYGLMQVHWYPGSPWLKGLKREDLLNPEINIRAGVHELAWWKHQHESHCGSHSDHEFYEHYKWGYKVKNEKYGESIMKKRLKLRKRFSSFNI